MHEITCEGNENKAPHSALVYKVKFLAIGMLVVPLDAAKEHVDEVERVRLAAAFKK